MGDLENDQLMQATAENTQIKLVCRCVYVCLTTVFMEDVGEAVQDAVTTATVGASFLNPLTVRDGPAAPTGREHASEQTEGTAADGLSANDKAVT